MGSIVGAYATSHVLMSPSGIEDQAERIFNGMKEIGRRVRADRPDVVVLISSDHLMNFKLDVQIPFIVGACEEYVPFGDMGIPQRPFPGHREFAEDLLRQASECSIDIAKAEELRPDHGVAIPNAVINPDGAIKVVPLYINATMTQPPSPKRAWALGNAIKLTVEQCRPEHERVVVVGTGGLSHWICSPGQGDVNETFDRHCLDQICSGHGQDLAGLTSNYIVENAGNGGLEFLCWICMAGAVPGWRGETIYYEAVPDWLTGMGGVAMHAAAAVQ